MKYLQLWMLRQNWSLTSAGSDGKLFLQEYWSEIGEPVVCSTQCLCEHESEKGEATYNAKYKVTVVWQQAVTAQCLFCEFTAPIPSPATFENALGQTEVFPTKTWWQMVAPKRHLAQTGLAWTFKMTPLSVFLQTKKSVFGVRQPVVISVSNKWSECTPQKLLKVLKRFLVTSSSFSPR